MTLEEKILQALRGIVDPETGLDVVRMGLVQNLQVDEDRGEVSLTFRPTSPVCPLGIKLGVEIQQALQAVPGVTRVVEEVNGFVHAEQLRELLAREG